MSASFYNANGTMIGGDIHDYYTGEPPSPPIPTKAVHFVFATFDGWCEDTATRPENVTSDGKPMIQKEFKRKYVGPHLPLTPLPPYIGVELAAWGANVWLSGSVALLGVASVTGAGKSLATCVYGCLGSNLNCGDPIDLPSDLVINENSVLTQPTDMDFAEAVFTWAVSGLVSLGVGKLFDVAGKPLKKYIIKQIRKEIVIPVRKWAEDKAKDFFNDKLTKPLKEKVRPSTRATLSALGVTHV